MLRFLLERQKLTRGKIAGSKKEKRGEQSRSLGVMEKKSLKYYTVRKSPEEAKPKKY